VVGIAGDVVSLSAAISDQFFAASMAGVAWLRIWNISRSPAQPAWIKAAPAATQLRVIAAASVTGWLAGDTVQLGDPTSVVPTRCIALDISPMLQNVLGAVFRQSGILLKMAVGGMAADTQLDASAAGVAGSFANCFGTADGRLTSIQAAVACSELSPVSNSNLVFIRETATGSTLGITILSSVAVYV
jgi:hypothetical protein